MWTPCPDTLFVFEDEGLIQCNQKMQIFFFLLNRYADDVLLFTACATREQSYWWNRQLK